MKAKTKKKVKQIYQMSEMNYMNIKWWERIVLWFIPSFRIAEDGVVVWMKYYRGTYFLVGVDYLK